MSGHTKYNVLTEKLLSVDHSDGSRADMSLPDVLQGLGAGRVVAFRALRPHQQHAWHAFLVQLAAMALHKAGQEGTEQTADRWRQLLLAMTDGENEPWCLVVDDFGKPAFMQPPIPEGKIGTKWKTISTPGALDVLVTAKNHDVKSQLIEQARLEHWFFALISLQTMEGFLGAGNYGIARMNGGFASRPGVAVTSEAAMGTRFLRDTAILVSKRNQMINEVWPYKSENGHELLWRLPWDGKDSIGLSECDPYFIEICRRIRFQVENGDLCAYGISTKSSRIEAKEIRGVTGDPWTPVTSDAKGHKALTITSSGFDYKLTQKLLFSGEYRHGMVWLQGDEKGEMQFVASALTRGQGKTEGLHRRFLKIPAKVASMSIDPGGRDKLAAISKKRIELCDEVRRKVLHRSLCMITQGAPEGRVDFRDTSDSDWIEAFERDVDAIFFERLFDQVDLDEEEADRVWTRELLDLAEKQLENALRSVPQPSIRAYRIESAARGIFHGTARKTFQFLFVEGDTK